MIYIVDDNRLFSIVINNKKYAYRSNQPIFVTYLSFMKGVLSWISDLAIENEGQYRRGS